METTKSTRGFANMDPERVREIARKGGQKVSQDREHMARIGSMSRKNKNLTADKGVSSGIDSQIAHAG